MSASASVLSRPEFDRLNDAALEAAAVLEAGKVGFLAELLEVSASGAYLGDGALSLNAWLRSRCEMSGASASALVFQVRLLSKLPELLEALRSGETTTEHVAMLARVVTDTRRPWLDQFAEPLTTLATLLGPSEFGSECRNWASKIDDHLEQFPDPGRHHLNVTPSLWGDSDVQGRLDAETTDLLLDDLDRRHRPDPEDGPTKRRALGQRRADAFGEMMRDLHHRGRDTTSSAPASTHSTDVVITLDQLAQQRPENPDWFDLGGSRCELERFGTIPPAVARELTCSAAARRIVLDADGMVIDVGRRTRLVTATQRMAVSVRDRHCVFPGCDRPPRWCDVHHLVPWAQGDSSDLQNLALLCRRHHTLVHQHGWQLVRDETLHTYRATRPDGVSFVTHHGVTLRAPPGINPSHLDHYT